MKDGKYEIKLMNKIAAIGTDLVHPFNLVFSVFHG